MNLSDQHPDYVDLLVSNALEIRLQNDQLERDTFASQISAGAGMIRYWNSNRRTLYHVPSISNHLELEDASQGVNRKAASRPAGEEAERVLKLLTSCPTVFDTSRYKQNSTSYRHYENGVEENNATGIDKLCQKCWDMAQNSVALETRLWTRDEKRQNEDVTHEVFPHHRNLANLQRSSSSGCHLCTLLLRLFEEDDRALHLDQDARYVLRIDFRIYSWYHKALCIQTSLFKTKPLSLRHDLPSRIPSPSLRHANTGHPEVLSLAKQWLESCLASHENCNKAHGPCTSFVPTRLVKVTQTFGGDISAQLVGRASLASDTPYLTLSYCWGGQVSCMLSTENALQFQQSLPQTMPKTLSDAFDITLFLGYRYIWVDCLCIMQNSRRDWEQESASMGSVYQHSVCTIAAVGAENTRAGCFFDRLPQSFLSCQLLDPMTDNEGYSRDATRTYPHHRPKPLNRRAWVFQERALSPRTINFGADQISWDCLETCSSEEDVSVNDIGGRMINFPMFQNLKIPFQELLYPTKHKRDYLTWCWHVLIQDYVKCDLTYPGDKWQAIQGLATAVSDAWGINMIYGLWVDRLGLDLLWSVYSNSAAIRVPIAPTWSWTSVHGDVSIYSALEDAPAMDAIVVAYPGEPGDRVLELDGVMICMQYQAIKDEAGVSSMITQDENVSALLDRSISGAGTINFDISTRDVGSNIRALQIATSAKSTEDHQNGLEHPHSYGLVIEPSNQNESTWHRVGYYSLPLIPGRIHAFGKLRSRILLE